MAIKYKELAKELELLIEQFQRKHISKLPSEHELCLQYSVSRQTVRQAFEILHANGLIEKRRGSGTYITGLSVNKSKNRIAVMVQDHTAYNTPILLNHLQHTLSDYGFDSIVYDTNYSFETERKLLLTLLSTPPKGLLIEGTKTAIDNPNDALLKELANKGCQIQFLTLPPSAIWTDSCLTQYSLAAVHKLCRHIFHPLAKVATLLYQDSMEGKQIYHTCMEYSFQNNYALSDSMQHWYHTDDIKNLRKNQDDQFIREVLDLCVDECDVLLCQTDEIAYYAYKACLQKEYFLHNTFKIATFGNLYSAEMNYSSILSVTSSNEAFAQNSALFLSQKIRGEKPSVRELTYHLNHSI